MKFLQSLVCSLTILYVSALILIVVLLHEELKIQLRVIFHRNGGKSKGLRHRHIAHNDSFYIEMYKNMHMNYSTIRDIENNRTINSLSSSLSMPWQTGLWIKKPMINNVNSNSVLSLKDVSQYANKVLWNRQGTSIGITKNKLNKKKYKRRILHIINPFGTNDKHMEETQVLL